MPYMSDQVIATGLATTLVQYSGGGTQYVVQTVSGALYCFVSTGVVTLGIHYRKSIDGGSTWTELIKIGTNAKTATALSIWYDRWSGIAAGLIHIAYQELSTDDTWYVTIDTESADAQSTETVIVLGATTAAGGHLSITRARGGNVYCKTCIDAGVEGGFYRLLNANVPNGAWDAARTINEALATTDQMILLPNLNNADTQDIYGIFFDASATELSRQNYDDSANTWAETSISTGMAIGSAATAFPHFAACCDLTNAQHIVVAWNGVDAALADLKCWTVTESAITAKTDIVANGTDDQALCAIGIDTDTGYWHAFYVGKSDGSEVWLTSNNIYKKISTDGGTTWSAEISVTGNAVSFTRNIKALFCTPRFVAYAALAYYHDGGFDELRCIRESVIMQTRAQLQLGI